MSPRCEIRKKSKKKKIIFRRQEKATGKEGARTTELIGTREQGKTSFFVHGAATAEVLFLRMSHARQCNRVAWLGASKRVCVCVACMKGGNWHRSKSSGECVRNAKCGERSGGRLIQLPWEYKNRVESRCELRKGE